VKKGGTIIIETRDITVNGPVKTIKASGDVILRASEFKSDWRRRCIRSAIGSTAL
jgi:hypothetical protein